MRIKRDIIGLYVKSGGYIARPNKVTIFNENDVVSTYHHGGSSHHSVKNINIKEIWKSYSETAYTYDFARDHYFESIEKFNEYLLRYHSVIAPMNANHPEWNEIYNLSVDIENECHNYYAKNSKI